MEKDYQYILEVLEDNSATKRLCYLAEGTYNIGSSEQADIQIHADGVSRHHAQIQVFEDGGVLLEDQGSTNGTFADRKMVRQIALTGNALLAFGKVQANLYPAHQGAAIALASEATSSVPAGKKSIDPGLATINVSMDAQLRSILGNHTALLVSGDIGGQDFARRLVRDWCVTLKAEAIEISQKTDGGDEHIVAYASSVEKPVSGVLSFQGVAGLQICIWRSTKIKSHIVESLMQLAMHILHGADPEAGTASDASSSAIAELPGPGSLNPLVLSQYSTCGKVAAGDIPILILGESGTGKEVIARWIHEQSGLDGPFRAMNCAALTRELLEAELFGVEKGAATGVEARAGLLEQAHGGTVFLDEFGDMAMETQAKLLRALEGTTIYRVGGNCPIPINVRFIAATNRHLKERIKEGHFRLDLFHRLAAFEVTLPALRDRGEDIPLLASYFFEQAQKKFGVQSAGITRAALSCLIGYQWPGNIRELKNEIERTTLLLESGEPLHDVHLSEKLKSSKSGEPVQDVFNLEDVVRNAEREAFAIALATAGGDAQQAMDLLGLSRTSYYRKLKQLRDDMLID